MDTRLMNLHKLLLTAALLLAAALAVVALAVEVKLVSVGPFAHVYYIDEVVSKKTIALQPGQRYTITFGLAPGEDYENYLLVVSIDKPSPYLQVLCRGACTYEKDRLGLVRKVYVREGNVTLLNAGMSTYVGKVTVTYVYVRKIEIPLTKPVVKLRLEVPDETGNAVTRQIVRVWVDNNVPYVVHDVVLPSNESLLDLALRGSQIRGVKIELKHVEIDSSAAPHGTYTVILRYDKSAVLPYALLVKALTYMNVTVPARSSIVITSSDFGVPRGWRLLGYIVAIAAIQPVMSEFESGGVRIVGSIVSPVTSQSGLINIKTVSYLIPSLVKFRYVVGAYVVYGSTFKIINNMSVPVLAYYIPLLYKPCGSVKLAQNMTVLVAAVPETDLQTGVWTVLVVQLPPFAEVEKIITPSGTVYTAVTESSVVWGTSERPISISPDRHEAYVTVAFGEMREPGVYRVYVRVEPLALRLVTTAGKPCLNCSVVLRCGESVYTLTPDEKGYVSIRLPVLLLEPVVADVYYDTVQLYRVVLNSIPVKPLVLEVKLYNVTVIVTNFRGEPLSGVRVVLRSVDGEFTREAVTDEEGIAYLINIPAGIYDLRVYAGNSEIASGKVEIDNNKIIRVNSSVIAIFSLKPLGTIVLTTTNVALAAAIIVGAVVVALALQFAGKLVRERRRGTEVIIG